MRKLSQARIAKLVGVHQTYVSRYLRGLHVPAKAQAKLQAYYKRKVVEPVEQKTYKGLSLAQVIDNAFLGTWILMAILVVFVKVL